MAKERLDLQTFGFASVWRKNIELGRFFFSSRLFFGIVLLLALVLMHFGGASLSKLWYKTLYEIKTSDTGAIFNVVTLLFIIALWLANIIKGWKDSLPKYLSVKFYCYDIDNEKRAYETQLECQDVLLSSEADIRAFYQQIGQQKNDNDRLPLDSSKYSIDKSLCYGAIDGGDEISFWHYEVNARLTDRPVSKDNKLKVKEEARLKEKAQEERFKKIVNTLESIRITIEEHATCEDHSSKNIEVTLEGITGKLTTSAEKNRQDNEDKFKQEVRAALLELKFNPRGGWKQ